MSMSMSMSTKSTSISKSKSTSMPLYKSKKVLFLRHGQATHNPRAEEAKRNGCSHERFLQLMEEDDEFDSELTPKGIQQAKQCQAMNAHKLANVDLVVSSPLSRAIKTADLAICPQNGIEFDLDLELELESEANQNDNQNNIIRRRRRRHPRRICIEELREINGWLLNAKRRTKSQLQQLFHPRWDFTSLTENDETWTPDIMESYEDCGERGYQALLWLLSQPDTSHDEKNDDNNGNNGNGNNDNETTILVVAHGGLLRFSLVDHPLIKLVDGREDSEKRFSNCELREYDVSICTETKDQNTCSQGQGQGQERPVVILTEIR
mmetsp:Transcript_19964/g.25193  ORF Transcript_19964/g.25193 Transcript_19964/m.25193 type:complete len:322 (-) Transcript_19964:453-1418(-)